MNARLLFKSNSALSIPFQMIMLDTSSFLLTSEEQNHLIVGIDDQLKDFKIKKVL